MNRASPTSERLDAANEKDPPFLWFGVRGRVGAGIVAYVLARDSRIWRRDVIGRTGHPPEARR